MDRPTLKPVDALTMAFIARAEPDRVVYSMSRDAAVAYRQHAACSADELSRRETHGVYFHYLEQPVNDDQLTKSCGWCGGPIERPHNPNGWLP